MNKILVVDDELSIRESFSLILEGKYKVFFAASGEGALKIAADEKIDLVFLDIRMPGLDGLETLKRLKEIDHKLEVVMVTAVNEVQKANEAIKLGARDYLIKPFDVETVLRLAESILRRKSLLEAEQRIEKETSKELPQLIGQGEKILEIVEKVEKVSSTNQKILILGETGTEKETLAELIHVRSPRSEFPFRIFHLSPQMFPAEIKAKLWGGAKGSTTLELKKIPGIFQEAAGGTVFLNHIEYFPADFLAELPSEVRLIAGSSINLAEKAKEIYDSFSEVIFYLPALRERISDLPYLIKHYLEKISLGQAREPLVLSAEALEILSNYDWPGNTAQLISLLEKLVLTTSVSTITAEDLPLEVLLKSA
ncbi:MAG: sigma-54-dependent transcriptional regulator, partial [Candidatus Margulisiibacteriota bacterium]